MAESTCATPEPFTLSTRDYVRFTRGYGLRDWLQAGPDYSRSVEYPLVVRLLEARAGHRLLDVGSGRRGELATLAARAGLDVTAIDPRDDLGVDAPPSPVRFLRADARELPFEDATFDRITAVSTIEHIEDGEAATMRELARLLAPAGRLVLSVPYNPLKRAEVFIRGGVYGRTGERVFFERVYDDEWLDNRILGPSGLREDERVLLTEPGVRLSRHYYDARGMPWSALRLRAPVGPLLALAAPRFFRPSPAAAFDSDDWTGAAAIVALAA